MSNRKRNMLEAFQASAQEAQGEHTPHSTGGAGGPFAEESRGSTRTPQPEPERAPQPQDEVAPTALPSLPQALARLPIGPIAGGALVVLMLAFYLGFLAGGSSTVEAAGDGSSDGFELAERETPKVQRAKTPARPTTLDQAAGNQAGGDQGTPYDSNFFALASEGITLRVAAYDQSARSEALAWEAYDYLLEQRLPVVRPLRMSENIFVFVGAVRSVSELGRLEEQVKALDGPRGGRPFGDAYPVNIKDYVQR